MIERGSQGLVTGLSISVRLVRSIITTVKLRCPSGKSPESGLIGREKGRGIDLELGIGTESLIEITVAQAGLV